ncbi:hypothetical protein F4814DRAFT_451616 [Daldinia grandis]|nr:hypothetical protein F4814DRAFT_451616 [Daldinia grandis]
MSALNHNQRSGILSAALYEDAVMLVAIIGILGHFPGDAENPQKLWDVISEGRNAASRIPLGRFNIGAFYHPNTERYGMMNRPKPWTLNSVWLSNAHMKL